MSVTHISFLFSHMLGVRNKLSDMELSAREVFPELSFILNDFSKKSRLVRFMLGFNKGFFIPLNVEVVIVRHNFFDFSLLIVFMLRKFLNKRNFLEHHSDHVIELQRRGFYGRLLAIHEVMMCKLAGSLIDGHISVSESVKISQDKYFRHPLPLIMENGYRLRQSVKSPAVTCDTKYSLVFCAAKFADWHGLDILIDFANRDVIFRENFTVYLVGDIGTYSVPVNFVACGFLPSHEIDELIRGCDMCVDSLGLARLGLTLSSSLKGKQYIANGKPILACCSVNKKYDEFTFFIDRKDEIGSDLIAFLSEVDHLLIGKVSSDLYDSVISWESVLMRLKLNLISGGFLT